MITEDYVSFETAKLLKEKGFNWACLHYWQEEISEFRIQKGILKWSNGETSNTEIASLYRFSAPALQTAIKWLREVHNIFFNVNYFHIDVGNKWACLTIWLPYKNGCEYSIERFDIEIIYDAAIKYCLENLI